MLGIGVRTSLKFQSILGKIYQNYLYSKQSAYFIMPKL